MANPPFFDGWRSDFPERPTRPQPIQPIYYPGDPEPLTIPTFIWVAITLVASVLGIIVFLWSMAAMGGFDQ